ASKGVTVKPAKVKVGRLRPGKGEVATFKVTATSAAKPRLVFVAKAQGGRAEGLGRLRRRSQGRSEEGAGHRRPLLLEHLPGAHHHLYARLLLRRRTLGLPRGAEGRAAELQQPDRERRRRRLPALHLGRNDRRAEHRRNDRRIQGRLARGQDRRRKLQRSVAGGSGSEVR